MREFGVPHFRIKVRFERLEDGKMNCDAVPEYERATIKIDCGDYEEDKNLETLEHDFEHELMHVVHSPFVLLRQQLFHIITDADKWNPLLTCFNQCCEMTVRNMERMAHGLRTHHTEAKAEIQ